jgi:hypothetical protein
MSAFEAAGAPARAGCPRAGAHGATFDREIRSLDPTEVSETLPERYAVGEGDEGTGLTWMQPMRVIFPACCPRGCERRKSEKETDREPDQSPGASAAARGSTARSSSGNATWLAFWRPSAAYR